MAFITTSRPAHAPRVPSERRSSRRSRGRSFLSVLPVHQTARASYSSHEPPERRALFLPGYAETVATPPPGEISHIWPLLSSPTRTPLFVSAAIRRAAPITRSQLRYELAVA